MRPRLHPVLPLLLAWLALIANLPAANPTTATNHWAFQPLSPQRVPAVRHAALVRNPVDAFVLARLEAAGVTFAAPAPAPALLRRLAFDLTGLPPESAIAELGPARLVEHFLASQQFGERWARWWLDVTGYVDVLGVDNDAATIKFADGKWRYRDYVVQAFNADQPFDRFLIEQLAGDALATWRGSAPFTDEARTLLTATAFLRSAPDDTDESEINTPANHHALLQQTIENVGQTLFALTLNCARCHDHKYEPLSQADYYRLLAHLAPAFNPAAWLQPKDRALADLAPALKADLDRHNAALDQEADALRRLQQALRDRYRDAHLAAHLDQVPAALRAEAAAAARTPFEKRSEDQRRLVGRFERYLRLSTEELKAALVPPDRAEWERLDHALSAVNARRRTPPLVHAVYDHGQPAPIHVLRRGEFNQPGPAVTPGLPAVLRAGDLPSPPSPLRMESTPAGNQPAGESSPRLALARQLTAPDSRAAALIARVVVNRVWQQLFGRGLVETTENLGVSGARPTHPELLDWLAGEFIRNGWHLKPLLRLIVSSTTYQQASTAPTALSTRAAQVDPDNQLLWRQRLRRLDSEMVRDALLAVGGQLDLTPGGPPILTTNLPDGSIVIRPDALRRPEDAFRRSLYLLQRRNYPASFLAAFDQPLLNAPCTRRSPSAVVAQSLTLLNDAFVHHAARALAARVSRAQPDTASRVTAAFRLALGRPPTPTEASWCRAAAETEGVRRLLAGEALESAREQALAHLCHTLLNTSEFLSLP